MSKKIILFDFDGVFVNSIGLCAEIIQLYNKSSSIEKVKEISMGNVHKVVGEGVIVKEPDGFDFQGLYKPKLLKLPLLDGAKEFIQKLGNNNFIVSSTRSDSIFEFLQKYGIETHFSEILGCDIEKSKDKKFQSIVDRFPGYELDFVTDTVGDIIEGEKFDLRTIAVTWGYHERFRLEKAKPDYIVDSFDELYELLK